MGLLSVAYVSRFISGPFLPKMMLLFVSFSFPPLLCCFVFLLFCLCSSKCRPRQVPATGSALLERNTRGKRAPTATRRVYECKQGLPQSCTTVAGCIRRSRFSYTSFIADAPTPTPHHTTRKECGTGGGL